ncbi:MAG: lysophospholipid acyltransferase family protein [Pseudomonadota bacterium]
MSETLRLSAPVQLLYPFYQWFVFVPLAVLATLVAVPIAIVAALLISPRSANLQIATRWARSLAHCAPVKVEIEGLEHADPEQSFVVVANHQSQFDIPVIYGFCGLDLRWVMKAELGWVPFIAQACLAIGHIQVNRSDPQQARTAINKAVGKLKPGTGILFFAEGTRSRTGQLLPFKKGAFRVAIDQQMPILPMTVIGTRDVMAADSVRIRPGSVRLVIHPPIPTQGLDLDELDALSDQVRGVIASGLERSV